MDEDSKKVTVSQAPGTSFALTGQAKADPVQANIVHGTDKPIVHMHLWNEDCVGKLDARLEVRGDPEKPVSVGHRFENSHDQSHKIETTLAKPVHHALQMRTPLQVRFCNAWTLASDYALSVDLRGRRFLDLRLTGATIATPQPCDDKEC